jgi:hypothetical protein
MSGQLFNGSGPLAQAALLVTVRSNQIADEGAELSTIRETESVSVLFHENTNGWTSIKRD